MGELAEIARKAAELRKRLEDGWSSGVVTATDVAILTGLIERLARHKEKDDA